jgi:ectoine hydroxylase-related dioxygenase (phytanoyl-CoA dioxygenase family)
MDVGEMTALRKQYKSDGVVCIRGALDRESMAMAEEAYKWSLANPSPHASQFQGTADSPDKFYQDLLNGKVLTGYRHMLEASNAADVVAELWDSRDVWFFYEQVFLKEGGESRRTPWHQDASYLPIDGEQLAVMWISFETIAKEDCLEFVRGSHRGILYDGSRFEPGDDTAPLYGTLPRLPDIEGARDRFDIVSWAVNPGDVLIFHPAMLHGGAPTHSGRRRRTLSLRFFGDDAVFAPRPGNLGRTGDGAETQFGEIKLKLAPGQSFRHPSFLKVRPRTSAAARSADHDATGR